MFSVMARCIRKYKRLLKFIIIIASVGGFLYQTLEFFFIYKEYPTVVDIQVAVPSELEMPGITFCSHSGMNATEICSTSGTEACTPQREIKNICDLFPEVCPPGKPPPEDFKVIRYDQFAMERDFTQDDLIRLAIPMEAILTCDIISSSKTRPCVVDDYVIGPYYSTSKLPSICYSINSVWGRPDKKPLRIQKSERIKLSFYMDIVKRVPKPLENMPVEAAFNFPSTAAVQLALHPPQYHPSPFTEGVPLMGGQSYEIQVTRSEKHLLPPPYQTRCTDYMKAWRENGGMAPLTQTMVLQECKMKENLRVRKCVPVSVDYPHNYTVCRHCASQSCPGQTAEDECTSLLSKYTQPCDFAEYEIDLRNVLIPVVRKVKIIFQDSVEKTVTMIEKYDCENSRAWQTECVTTTVEIAFDKFEITNFTYNAKFEALELLNVVGGYLGMYLGISLVAVYEMFETLYGILQKFIQRKRGNKATRLRKFHKRPLNHSKASRNTSFEADFGPRNAIYPVYEV